VSPLSAPPLRAATSPITDLIATAYTIPTDAPEADGTLSWDSTTLVVAQAHCGEVVGTGWTYGSPACTTVINTALADQVTGRDALDIAGASDAMVKALRNVGRQGVGGQSLSAVDIALWDLKARLLNVPLHRLIGAVRDAAEVYGSGGFTCYNERQLRDQLHFWTDTLRIPRVKIKIGESWGTCLDRDLARMDQARDAIGDTAELYVDANGAYTRKQAIRMMTDAADLDVHWFEEPVSSDDLDGLRAVSQSVIADVTAGEYGYDLPYFRRMCQAGAVDCLQADASRCGGITEWLRVAAVAASHGLDISAHCAPHLHLHAGLATPNLRHLEWFHDHARIELMAFDGTARPIDGLLRPDPDAPGHGLTLRACDIEKYRQD
jgi:L-alanine-DL-glutamate epimerase-like enolase superfamily enzyme